MRLWRSSDHADLSWRGGLQVCGRWHSHGRRIVYLSDHPASALLEVLVHLEVDPEDLPASYQLLAVDIPDKVEFDRIAEDELVRDWREDAALTRSLGDHWLQVKRTLLLQVPSAIVPVSVNWLFNPAHADASSARIVKTFRAAFDSRLFRTA